MSLDPPYTRWLVHISAVYPGGDIGWAVFLYSTEASVDEILGPVSAQPTPAHPLLEDLLALAVAYYHRAIGPAYGGDDFAFTLWPFDSPLELFWAAGGHLMATDGIVPDYRGPALVTSE